LKKIEQGVVYKSDFFKGVFILIYKALMPVYLPVCPGDLTRVTSKLYSTQ